MDGWITGLTDRLMDWWMGGWTDHCQLQDPRAKKLQRVKLRDMVHWWMGPGGRGLWLWEMGTGRLGLGKQFALGKNLKPMLPTSVGCRQRFRKTRTASRKGNDRVHQVTRTALPTMQIGMPGLLECQIWNHTLGQHLQNNYITTTLQLHNNLHYNYTTTHFLPHMGARRSNKKDVLNFLKKLPPTV